MIADCGFAAGPPSAIRGPPFACAGCHVYAGADMFDSTGKTCLRKGKHGALSLLKLLVETHQIAGRVLRRFLWLL
jgi:hypothetical protein